MRENKILLKEEELKAMTKLFIGEKGLVIKNIKFLPKEHSLEIKGTIKKMFSLDGNIILKIKNFNKKSITLKIEKITSLKIDIFSKIKNVLESKTINRFESKGIIVKGEEIIIDGYKILNALNLGNSTLENIEVLNEGLLINLSNISKDKLVTIKKLS